MTQVNAFWLVEKYFYSRKSILTQGKVFYSRKIFWHNKKVFWLNEKYFHWRKSVPGSFGMVGRHTHRGASAKAASEQTLQGGEAAFLWIILPTLSIQLGFYFDHLNRVFIAVRGFLNTFITITLEIYSFSSTFSFPWLPGHCLPSHWHYWLQQLIWYRVVLSGLSVGPIRQSLILTSRCREC